MKTCALVIGHKKRSPGAVNTSQNLSEFDYNERLALEIEAAFCEHNKVRIQRIYRRTYTVRFLTTLMPLNLILLFACTATHTTPKQRAPKYCFTIALKKGKGLLKYWIKTWLKH
ncbi:MAG: hypothetical protein L3J38_04490 [Thiomicrorhabdus sp.]|nr:hypothetical protein [Thiomicrorhabdus sp.]